MNINQVKLAKLDDIVSLMGHNIVTCQRLLRTIQDNKMVPAQQQELYMSLSIMTQIIKSDAIQLANEAGSN